MFAVLRYVAEHPGCTKGKAAEAAGPRRAGYDAVGRCIRAGLLTAEPVGYGFALSLTPLGRSIIDRPAGR